MTITVDALFAPYRPDDHGASLDVEVRPASPPDVLACGELLARREGGDPDAWCERVDFWLESGQQVLVAAREEEVLGYGRLAFQTPSALGGRNVPDGWYLSGIIVDPRYRRRGIGRALTRARCQWAWDRGERVYFVANSINRASIDLHRELGFRELTRDFEMPGVTFVEPGEGVLFVGEESGQRQQVVQLRVGSAR